MPDTPDSSTVRAEAAQLSSSRPALMRWISDYDPAQLRGDLAAGLTLAVVLVPQSMAYAMLLGVPAFYGLYASLVPLLVYPFLGTSHRMAIGIVAVDMIIAHAGLSVVAEPGSPRYVQLAILLALVVGLLQTFMALTRMGFLVNLLSQPVMVGFTSGAALIIVASQLGGLTGVDLGDDTFVPTLLLSAVEAVPRMDITSLVFGLGAVTALLTLRRWRRAFPGSLAVVVVGTLAVFLLGLEEGGVAVVGEVPPGLPGFELPAIDLAGLRAIVPTALALAFVQFLKSISLGKVFTTTHGPRLNANSELAAIGSANILGAFFQALPVSGSLSRTALNDEAGGRSPAANWVTAAVVGITLLFLTPVLAFIPVPVLSAIIVVAALNLLDVKRMRFLLKAKTVDGWIALLTFAATLVWGILQGILVGVVASVIAIMYRIGRPNVAELGHLPGTRSFRDKRHSDAATSVQGILLLRVDASFSFMNAEFLRDLILERTGPESEVRAVVVDASSVNDLDITAAEILMAIKEILDERDVPLLFGGVKEPVRKVLHRSGLWPEMGGDRRFFLSPHRAVRYVLTHWGEEADYLSRVPGEGEGEAVEDGMGGVGPEVDQA